MVDDAKRDSDWWSSHGPERSMARKVKALRLKLGMSQRDLADQMRDQGFQFDQATVSRIESGTRSIGLNEAAAIAAILKIPAGRRAELLEVREDDDDLAILHLRLGQLTAEHDGIRHQLHEVDRTLDLTSTQIEQLNEALISLRQQRDRLGSAEMMTSFHIQRLRGRIEEMQMVAAMDADDEPSPPRERAPVPTSRRRPGSAPRPAAMRTGDRTRRG